MATRKERRAAERDKQREEEDEDKNNKFVAGKGKKTQQKRKGGKGKAYPKSRNQEGNKPKGPVIHQVLPPEILLHIFTLASVSTASTRGEKRSDHGVAILLKCRLVCKEWGSFCADSTLPLRARLEEAKIGNGAPFVWSRENASSPPTLFAGPYPGSQFEWDSTKHNITHIDAEQTRKEIWKTTCIVSTAFRFHSSFNALLDLVWWQSQGVLLVWLRSGELFVLKGDTGEILGTFSVENLKKDLDRSSGDIHWLGLAEDYLLVWVCPYSFDTGEITLLRYKDSSMTNPTKLCSLTSERPHRYFAVYRPRLNHAVLSVGGKFVVVNVISGEVLLKSDTVKNSSFAKSHYYLMYTFPVDRRTLVVICSKDDAPKEGVTRFTAHYFDYEGEEINRRDFTLPGRVIEMKLWHGAIVVVYSRFKDKLKCVTILSWKMVPQQDVLLHSDFSSIRIWPDGRLAMMKRDLTVLLGIQHSEDKPQRE